MKTPTQEYQHWKLNVDADGIWWLHIDQQDNNTNVLCVPVLEELDAILDRALRESPLGVVIKSDKKNGFIAGADIKEFTKIIDFDHAVKHIKRGQAVLNKLESLPCVTVALIHGFCMGGGLELALTCRYRIVLDDAKTTLSLPEVQLGIHPGFGGTVRLPRVIGAPAALDLMLTGKPVNARKAKKLGLADYMVAERHFLESARRVVLEKPRKRPLKGLAKWSNHAVVRPLIARQARKKLRAKVSPQHYPAPYKILDLWQSLMDKPREMMDQEAANVAELVIGETSKNLVKVFFLREQLKAAGKSAAQVTKPQHVHVIGAGVMGGDIAAWCALRGLQVTLQDRRAEVIAKAIGRANKLFERKMRGDKRGVTAALDRLTPDIEGHGVHKADIIIEAIIENVEAKQGLYKQLEPQMKEDALLTTNTSSIPIEELNQALDKPERLVGLHFFNPVAQMPLIEIVSGDNTDSTAAGQVAAFAAQIGKLPLPVKSSPGFLVNRILMPYMMEAVRLHEEGVSVEVIDKVATRFGMPMGPLHLADTVGLDICLSVASILGKELGLAVPDTLKQMVDQGKLGAKSDEGFYSYKDGKKPASDEQKHSHPDLTEIENRLIGRMVNESMACLREGVVADRQLLDAGVIFGTGFAPFRGGPLNYVESAGFSAYKQTLTELQSKYGEDFKPDDEWQQFAT